MSKMAEANKKIENAAVSGYKAIENAVVGGYKKIEDGFVRTFLSDDAKTKPESDDSDGEKDTGRFAGASERIETAIVAGYKATENAAVSGYKAIETAVVDGYKKIEDGFVKKFLPDEAKPESVVEIMEGDADVRD